jgi:hypothetical protein
LIFVLIMFCNPPDAPIPQSSRNCSPPDELPEPEYTPERVPVPTFTPWRAQRERAGGWSAAAQRAFIYELTRIGSVSAAARVVGKTARSAYQLRDKDGAESFAAAWELAMLKGQENAQQVAIERALHGEVMPTFRAGRFTGYKIVHNDKMLIAALSSARGNGGAFERPVLADWQRRLEKWEGALRREAMNLADGAVTTREAQEETWEDHVVWKREMKIEARRQRNAEIRATVRKGAAKAIPPEPRVRMLRWRCWPCS